MKRILYLLLVFGLACKPQPDTSSATDKATIYQSFIDQLVERGQFNGNVLVAEKGEVVFRASVGLNSVEGDSLSIGSQFRLASVSKQFTCTAIMQLKEKGTLAYDDSVQKYIPEWPYPGTVRQLMHHTSGVPSYETLFDEKWMPELAADDPARSMHGNEHMVSFIVEHQPEPHFEPGEKYEYSNTAYVLLATIVSRVSGQPFEEYMRQNVYLPAGMEDTYVYSPLREDPMTRRVYGFRETSEGELIPSDYHFVNPVAGDGGTYSTIDDLFSWNQALYTDEIVSQASLKEAFAPAVLNSGDTSWYGFGWGIDPGGQWGKRVSHGGGWVGFRTYIDRLLDDESCIIVLTNHSSPYLGGAVRGLRDIAVDGTYTLPEL